MKMLSRVALASLALSAIVATWSWGPASASAQSFACGGEGVYSTLPYWWAYSGGASLYSLGHIPTPPYYALHPPVYYSYPVPRPYGFSPYAYPGSMMTPEILVPSTQPEVIPNPYVEPEAAPTSRTAAVRPAVIMNPFVVGAAEPAAEEFAVVVEGPAAR